MTAKEFNLLQEPWVLVLTPDGEQKELSLLEAFEQAPSLLGLAGELPTQDFAVLRLMLAILHAVVGRQMDGSYLPLGMAGNQPINPGFIKQRWHHLWQQGALPLQEIKAYLKRYEDRFWLFHPVRPFYQIPNLESGTEYFAFKLLGTLAESNNKKRLFCLRTDKNKLSYAEATRWLIHLHAFDDSSVKKQDKNTPSSGVGHLARLGLIAAKGDNLFETLMLNLVLIPDGGASLWGIEQPTWVSEEAKSAERSPIVVPNNPSELLSLQSRRISLKREAGQVVRHLMLGGDFFPDNEELFAEQMTLWRKPGKNSSSKREYEPKVHNAQRQVWRDFSSIASTYEDPSKEGANSYRRPGLINWLATLQEDDLLPKRHLAFQTASVKFDDNNGAPIDTFSDSLTFSAEFLSTFGEQWVNAITNTLATTEQMVRQFAFLARNLLIASGNTTKGTSSVKKNEQAVKKAQEQAYFSLDKPFREWLQSIDPKNDSLQEAKERWLSIALVLLIDLGREMVYEAGERAFVGHTITNDKKAKERFTSPEAYRNFIFKIKSL